MIVGQRLTEKAYRALEALSQTMIRDFYEDRKKFYKKYIAKEFVEEEMSQAIKMGHLVHCLWLTPQEFDEKFFMSICTEAPTGLMLKFTQSLARATLAATDEEGIVRKEFAELASEAYQVSGFKWDLYRVLNNFNGTQAENYYQELRASIVAGQIVITTQDIENANRIVIALKTGEFTSRILAMENDPDVEVFDELPITDYVIEGRPFKSLIDRLEVNHREKYLQPLDGKIVWTVENFYTEYYLKRFGYLQAATYDLACTHIRNQDYPGYEVRPMKFLACDSINYYSPLIYSLTLQDIVDALQGFKHRGRMYKGLITLVRELNWHMDNAIWNMSMDNHLNGGIVEIGSLRQD